MSAYYREQVVGGPGAFLMTVTDYTDFAEAIRRKLVREIGGLNLSSVPAKGDVRLAAGAPR